MTNQQGVLQYADRDHTDLGSYYLRHVSAMTGEALHSKSAIAAELAHRDREIDRLQAENANLNAGYTAARLEIESLQARIKTMAEEHADELMVAHMDGMRAAQAAPAAGAGTGSGEVVAHRLMRKSLSGEWESDARDWSDGPPSRALVDSICADQGRWRIDVAYAAPTTQPAPQHEAQQYLEDDGRPTPPYTRLPPAEGMVGEWISVDERLPQPFEEVVVSPRPDDYCCEAFCDMAGNWKWAEYEHNFGVHHRECHVEYWLMLPEVPAPPTTSAGSGKGE